MKAVSGVTRTQRVGVGEGGGETESYTDRLEGRGRGQREEGLVGPASKAINQKTEGLSTWEIVCFLLFAVTQ